MSRKSTKDLTGKNKNEYRLVLLTQTGDKQSFDELIQTVQMNLYRHIYNITQDRAISDDLFQEVLIIIFKKIRWLRDPRFFRSWMYQIATRTALKAIKKNKMAATPNIIKVICHPAASFPLPKYCAIGRARNETRVPAA